MGETRALAYTSVISLLDSNGYMSGFDRMNSLVVEVGARDLVSFHSWLEEDDKRFVISFEIAVPPFAQSHPRQLVINAAAGPVNLGRFVVFEKRRWGELNSLTDEPSPADVSSMHGLASTGSAVTAVIPLRDVLARVPPHMRIPLIKIDTNGLDKEVVLSAGDLIRRTERFLVEVVHVIINDDRETGTVDTEKGGHHRRGQELRAQLALSFWRKEDSTELFAGYGFSRERCWPIKGAWMTSGNGSHQILENCMFAQERVHMQADCNYVGLAERLHAEKLGILSGLGKEIGPLSKRESYQQALLLERHCCGSEVNESFTAPVGCFDDTYTRKRCCLSDYLAEIDIGSPDALDVPTVLGGRTRAELRAMGLSFT